MTNKAPFPWFGGKSRVADVVWSRLGDVNNYVEPFAGSLAVLLGRPHEPNVETVNDIDGYICNFWRAVSYDAATVARWCDWPVNENDLHARHAWLVARKADLVARLEGDPEFYDAKVAGWWCGGICCWIGSEWCSGKGPWYVVDGKLVKGGEGEGVKRRRVHLNYGMGVHRQRVHLGDSGIGVHRASAADTLYKWFDALQSRLRRVRVACGDWLRVCGPSVTTHNGLTGVFLDPPYGADASRASDIYTHDSLTVADDVRRWAIEHGNDPKMRIALCGYEGEHEMPPDWECHAWSAGCGYGNKGTAAMTNRHKERIYFSPHCLKPAATASNGQMFKEQAE